VIDEPTSEPVSIDEVKVSSRFTGESENALALTFIKAARIELEKATGRTIFQKTLELALPHWPIARMGYSGNVYGRGALGAGSIELQWATTLIEIESVTLTDSTEAASTWNPTEYLADIYSEPGRLVLAYGKSFPSFTPSPVAPIRILYTAGQVNSPEPTASADIKEAIFLLVGSMYDYREAAISPDRVTSQLLEHPRFRSLVNSLKVEHYSWDSM